MELLPLVACPHCGSGLTASVDRSDVDVVCSDDECQYSREGFPSVDGKPALIDFDASILSRERVATSATDQAIETAPGLKERLRGFLMGGNAVAPANCQAFIKEIKSLSDRPRVLVIGGGSVGAGMEALYADPLIDVVGTDIYASENVDVLADGHRLPFRDGAFHGVVIQAVLEHVLEPHVVAAEIYRVLRPAGIVYAETPFMQQVHMAAYDFTRYTPSGHRWLFRRFDEIAAGTVGGPGLSLFWSIRYFIRSLARSDKIATALSMPFFWLRYLDRFADPRYASDAANGVYFIGRRSEWSLRPRQMLAYYTGPQSELAGGQLEPVWPSATTTRLSDFSGTPVRPTSKAPLGG
ncbi:MAG: class I SAM-dependent methyltransferase [Hyphomicrobiaceae bacterium]|nr:class I SAM-dependent methyltransferase [Hyphomicrobiaceae bacterium]